MPAKSRPVNVHGYTTTVRYARGYRYLDRCGEVLLRLEEVMHPSWAVVEAAPKGGTLRSDLLGMLLTFDSNSLTATQMEYVDRETFIDQSLTALRVVCENLEIVTLVSPAMQVTLQKAYSEDEEADANRDLISAGLAIPQKKLTEMLGGTTTAFDFVAVTDREETAWGATASVRRRIEAKVIRQLPTPKYDSRLLSRVKLLPSRQQDAMAGLHSLRKKMPDLAPVAIQYACEVSCEGELTRNQFDSPAFFADACDWSAMIAKAL